MSLFVLEKQQAVSSESYRLHSMRMLDTTLHNTVRSMLYTLYSILTPRSPLLCTSLVNYSIQLLLLLQN